MIDRCDRGEMLFESFETCLFPQFLLENIERFGLASCFACDDGHFSFLQVFLLLTGCKTLSDDVLVGKMTGFSIFIVINIVQDKAK